MHDPSLALAQVLAFASLVKVWDSEMEVHFGASTQLYVD
jgi:hypothetical protein